MSSNYPERTLMDELFNPEFQCGYTENDAKGLDDYRLIRRVAERALAGQIPGFNPELMQALCQNARTCLDAGRYMLDADLYADSTRLLLDKDFESRFRLFRVASGMLARIEPAMANIPLKNVIVVLASLYEG